MRSVLSAVLLLGLAAGGVLAGCSSLPSLEGRIASTVLPDTDTTRIGMAVAPEVAAHPGKSGVYSLSNGRDAFASRVLLANAAERSLDVQYYIWRNDITGMLLFNSLRAAAGRGVRVRLLLDDNNTAGLDPTLAMLDADPNIEVRLFNPFVLRSPRVLGYLTDFFRLNRRMHNKSFTADNQATIIGGRNVGDEYFGAAGDVLFADLDVLAVGPVVDAVSRDFDRYWNSASAYPLPLLVPAATPESIAQLNAEALRVEGSEAARLYLESVGRTPFVAQLAAHSLPLEWATTRLVSDDPAKALGLAAPETKVTEKLKRMLDEPKSELELVSPYFVPGEAGTAAFAEMAERGVKVYILTNSLEATDVAAVHAGYSKRRRDLLEAGVALYELRRSWGVDSQHKRAGPLGSSGSSLHAKTFASDRKRIFIGSFNFDPRSAELNTEMGFVIDSPKMAQRMAATLATSMPLRAYEVRLAEDGKLFWIERGEGAPIRHDTEPGTSFWQRAGVRLLSYLPIDWLL